MPYTGHDALEAATAILTALYDWRKRLTDKVSTIEGIGSPQCTVGLIEGGINTNVVPDRVSFRLDRRMIPEESPADVERELRDLIKGAARNAAGIEVEIRRNLLARPLTTTTGGGRAVKRRAAGARRVVGGREGGGEGERGG